MKCRIQGISSAMHSFESSYGLVLGQLLLQHSDNLSMALQSQEMSAAEGQKITEMTFYTLHSIISDAKFEWFWKKVIGLAKELDVDGPVLPRQRKRPRRYEASTSEGSFPQTVQDLYRITYFEAFDLLISGIKSCFDQPGYRMYSKLEDLLVKEANKEEIKEEMKLVIEFYKDDFNEGQLKMQLGILSSNIPDSSLHNLPSVLQYLRSLTSSQQALMSEVCALAALIVVMLQVKEHSAVYDV